MLSYHFWHSGLRFFFDQNVNSISKYSLGNKERFDKEFIGIKEPISRGQFAIYFIRVKDKEHLALRNNFRATRKFLIAKFDCIRNQ